MTYNRMRLWCFYLGILLQLSTVYIIMVKPERAIYTPTIAWMAGLMLGFALFSREKE